MTTVQVLQERPPLLLSADEVGRRLGIDVSTVYRMASDGRLPARKVGRQWRFPAHVVGTTPVPPVNIDPVRADAVAAVSAHLLGVMSVITDLDGVPLTRVHNPCDRYLGASAEEATACVHEWRRTARSHDFTPRFEPSALGFECAAAFIRAHDRLVGLVIVGGVARDDAPAADVYVLTGAQRALVLESLPRIAAAVMEGSTS
jgi:excisionase family DNA binding protein